MHKTRYRRRGLALALMTAAIGSAAAADRADYLLPWNPPPTGGVQFSAPPVDAIADLHGDIVDPQLTVFFAGNQFMVVHDLLAAFRQAYPQYRRIFVETLPPGILAKQIETGALVMGNLRIALKPDVFTAGKASIAEHQKQHGWFADTCDYARNPLAILVAQGNPKGIHGLADLGRRDVRVSMPNPAWEGIARQIEASYRKAGGEALDTAIMQTKLADGTPFSPVSIIGRPRCACCRGIPTPAWCGRPRHTSSSRSCIIRCRPWRYRRRRTAWPPTPPRA